MLDFLYLFQRQPDDIVVQIGANGFSAVIKIAEIDVSHGAPLLEFGKLGPIHNGALANQD